LATDLGEPAWEPPWAAALAGERLDIRFLFLQCQITLKAVFNVAFQKSN
jgi:hypothetical protein